jgi:hypothetical protein
MNNDKDLDFSDAPDIEITEDAADDSVDSSWDEFDEDPAKEKAGKSSDNTFSSQKKKKSFLQKYFNLIIVAVVLLGGGAYFFGMMLFPPAGAPTPADADPQQAEIAPVQDETLAQVDSSMPTGITELPSDSAPMPAPIESDNLAVDVPAANTPSQDLIPLPVEDLPADAAASNVPPVTDISEQPPENNNQEAALTAGTNPAQPLAPVPVEPVLDAAPPAPVVVAGDNIAADGNAPQVPMAADIAREYEEKIAAAEKQFADEKKSLEDKISGANKKITELEEKIESLNRKLEEESKKTVIESSGNDLPVSREVPSKKQTPSPAPVLKSKPPADQTNSSARWELRSAQSGRAVLAPRGSNDLVTVGVGDVLPGIGRITAIDMIGGQWVVQGTQARLAR